MSFKSRYRRFQDRIRPGELLSELKLKGNRSRVLPVATVCLVKLLFMIRWVMQLLNLGYLKLREMITGSIGMEEIKTEDLSELEYICFIFQQLMLKIKRISTS